VAAAVGVPLLVAGGLIALIAANDDDGEGATPAPSSTTTVTASPEAKAFQTQIDDAFKPLGDAIRVFLPKAQEFEAGKVTPADFKANVDLALPEFVKARDAVAKVEPYKPTPSVNRYFVDAADLYVETARIYNVAVDPASEALRAQLNVAARRLRTLGDRIYDRGRVVLDPTFYAPPSQDVELRPPTEVPDWVAEGMADPADPRAQLQRRRRPAVPGGGVGEEVEEPGEGRRLPPAGRRREGHRRGEHRPARRTGRHLRVQDPQASGRPRSGGRPGAGGPGRSRPADRR
jgi:hypothetical protein